MKLFSPPLLRGRSIAFEIPDEQLTRSTKIIANWAKSLYAEGGIRTTRELSIQGQFLIRIFEDCLGYTTQSTGDQLYSLIPEMSVKQDSADGGLGFYGATSKKTIVVIELKNAKTSLDKKQIGRERKETPVEQGYRYANKIDSCKWIIVSNFREIRLYSKVHSEEYYESFYLDELEDLTKFKEFYYLLCRRNLICKAGPSEIDNLLTRSVQLSKEISNNFYMDYSKCRLNLFSDLIKVNTGLSRSILLEKAQKILDRLIFVFFCEDSTAQLLPSGTVQTIIEAAPASFEDREDKLWDQCRGLFRAINQGMPSRVPAINAYNGGLFAQDVTLDRLIVRDVVLKPILELNDYDFESDLDVNVLGHVFERSILDIETLKTEIDGVELDKTATRRKKEGIFYTPEYITRYIVERALGSYLAENPDRFKSVKILDPACGSGAFLNQAYNFMKDARRTKRAELEAAALVEREARLVRQSRPRKRRSRQIEDLNTVDGLEVGRELSNEWAYADDSALLRHLYGVDLNEESAEITKLSLWLKTAKITEPLKNLDNNIRVGNSLIDDNAVAGHRAFKWDQEFPEIMASGGFDVIIGNPPWIFARSGKLRADEKEFYYRTFEVAKYQLNTYALFIEQSFRKLRDGGKLAFIVPNTWLTIISFEPLRRFVLENTADLEIINIYGKVFDEAHVDCCMVSFTKGKSTHVTLGEMYDLTVQKYDPLNPVALTATGTCIINISQLKDRPAIDITNTINDRSSPLKQYAKLKTGFVAYEVGKGTPPQTKQMKDARIYHSRKNEGEGWYKYLDGRDVRRYGLGWSGQYVKYGKNLAARRDRALYETERILVRQIPSKPPHAINAAYTDTVMLLNDRNSNIIFDFKIEPQAILGIINSRLTTFWFAYTFDKFQRGLFPQFKLAELAQFPIPTNIKSYEEKLVSHVNSMTACGNARAEALLNTINYLEASYGLSESDITTALTYNNWALLNNQLHSVSVIEREQIYAYFSTKQMETVLAQRNIDLLDDQIDTLVFEMFGLSDDQRHQVLDWA